MGSFITEDPIKDGNNWYIYANNNPLKYTDPTGLYTAQLGGSFASGAGTGVTAGTGFAISWNPQNPTKVHFGSYNFQGLGSHFGINSSLSADFSLSTNPHIFDLGGNAVAIGLSAGWPTGPAWGGVTSEGSISMDGAFPVYTFSLSGGTGTPFEGHSYYTNTQVYSIKEFDISNTMIYSFVQNLRNIYDTITNNNQGNEGNSEGHISIWDSGEYNRLDYDMTNPYGPE